MRITRRIAVGAGLLVLLALLTFAFPIREWRTGELAAPPLPVVEGGPLVAIPPRVWIDTDAACGAGRTTDPDDCFAIVLMALAPEVDLVGISTSPAMPRSRLPTALPARSSRRSREVGGRSPCIGGRRQRRRW